MRSTEVRAIGDLAGRTLAGAGTMVRDLHMAVADRAFTAVGPGGAPARVIHDGVAEALYGGVRTALGALRARRPGRPSRARPRRGAGAGAVVARQPRPRRPERLRRRRPGRRRQPAGAGHDAAPPRRRPAARSRRAGAARSPTPVRAWRSSCTASARPTRRGGCAPTRSGPATARACSATSATRRSSCATTPACTSPTTAARSPRCWRSCATRWPVAMRGDRHRRALDGRPGRAQRLPLRPGRGAPLDERVRHVFCLGSPHLGAPLEKGVNALGWALGRVPETRPLANAAQCAQRRDQGPALRVLRRGGLVRLRPRRAAHRPLPRRALPARRALLLRRPRRSASAPATRWARSSETCSCASRSASGAGRRRQIGFAIEDGHHVGGLTHFDLLNHPAVYDQIRAWIER